jgi:hypothetical protein
MISGLLSLNRIVTDFLGNSARKVCYNHINTWGDIILGNYYILCLVVSVSFSIFFRSYYLTLARIWFIIIIANKGYIYIYYKLPQLLVILVTAVTKWRKRDLIISRTK